METVSKALGAELAALKQETRRRSEQAALAHETEVGSSPSPAFQVSVFEGLKSQVVGEDLNIPGAVCCVF